MNGGQSDWGWPFVFAGAGTSEVARAAVTGRASLGSADAETAGQGTAGLQNAPEAPQFVQLCVEQ